MNNTYIRRQHFIVDNPKFAINCPFDEVNIGYLLHRIDEERDEDPFPEILAMKNGADG